MMGAYVDGKPFSVELVTAVGCLVVFLIPIDGSETDRL